MPPHLPCVGRTAQFSRAVLQPRHAASDSMALFAQTEPVNLWIHNAWRTLRNDGFQPTRQHDIVEYLTYLCVGHGILGQAESRWHTAKP